MISPGVNDGKQMFLFSPHQYFHIKSWDSYSFNIFPQPINNEWNLFILFAACKKANQVKHFLSLGTQLRAKTLSVEKDYSSLETECQMSSNWFLNKCKFSSEFIILDWNLLQSPHPRPLNIYWPYYYWSSSHWF